MADDPQPTEPERRSARSDEPAGRHTPLTQQLGRITLVVVAVLFAVFALGNAQHVDFSWIFGSSEVVQVGGERASGGVRLIILLVAAFAAGLVVGAGAVWSRRRHRDTEHPEGET